MLLKVPPLPVELYVKKGALATIFITKEPAGPPVTALLIVIVCVEVVPAVANKPGVPETIPVGSVQTQVTIACIS